MSVHAPANLTALAPSPAPALKQATRLTPPKTSASGKLAGSGYGSDRGQGGNAETASDSSDAAPLTPAEAAAAAADLLDSPDGPLGSGSAHQGEPGEAVEAAGYVRACGGENGPRGKAGGASKAGLQEAAAPETAVAVMAGELPSGGGVGRAGPTSAAALAAGKRSSPRKQQLQQPPLVLQTAIVSQQAGAALAQQSEQRVSSPPSQGPQPRQQQPPLRNLHSSPESSAPPPSPPPLPLPPPSPPRRTSPPAAAPTATAEGFPLDTSSTDAAPTRAPPPAIPQVPSSAPASPPSAVASTPTSQTASTPSEPATALAPPATAHSARPASSRNTTAGTAAGAGAPAATSWVRRADMLGATEPPAPARRPAAAIPTIAAGQRQPVTTRGESHISADPGGGGGVNIGVSNGNSVLFISAPPRRRQHGAPAATGGAIGALTGPPGPAVAAAACASSALLTPPAARRVAQHGGHPAASAAVALLARTGSLASLLSDTPYPGPAATVPASGSDTDAGARSLAVGGSARGAGRAAVPLADMTAKRATVAEAVATYPLGGAGWTSLSLSAASSETLSASFVSPHSRPTTSTSSSERAVPASEPLSASASEVTLPLPLHAAAAAATANVTATVATAPGVAASTYDAPLVVNPSCADPRLSAGRPAATVAVPDDLAIIPLDDARRRAVACSDAITVGRADTQCPSRRAAMPAQTGLSEKPSVAPGPLPIATAPSSTPSEWARRPALPEALLHQQSPAPRQPAHSEPLHELSRPTTAFPAAAPAAAAASKASTRRRLSPEATDRGGDAALPAPPVSWCAPEKGVDSPAPVEWLGGALATLRRTLEAATVPVTTADAEAWPSGSSAGQRLPDKTPSTATHTVTPAVASDAAVRPPPAGGSATTPTALAATAKPSSAATRRHVHSPPSPHRSSPPPPQQQQQQQSPGALVLSGVATVVRPALDAPVRQHTGSAGSSGFNRGGSSENRLDNDGVDVGEETSDEGESAYGNNDIESDSGVIVRSPTLLTSRRPMAIPASPPAPITAPVLPAPPPLSPPRPSASSSTVLALQQAVAAPASREQLGKRRNSPNALRPVGTTTTAVGASTTVDDASSRTDAAVSPSSVEGLSAGDEAVSEVPAPGRASSPTIPLPMESLAGSRVPRGNASASPLPQPPPDLLHPATSAPGSSGLHGGTATSVTAAAAASPSPASPPHAPRTSSPLRRASRVRRTLLGDGGSACQQYRGGGGARADAGDSGGSSEEDETVDEGDGDGGGGGEAGGSDTGVNDKPAGSVGEGGLHCGEVDSGDEGELLLASQGEGVGGAAADPSLPMPSQSSPVHNDLAPKRTSAAEGGSSASNVAAIRIATTATAAATTITASTSSACRANTTPSLAPARWAMLASAYTDAAMAPVAKLHSDSRASGLQIAGSVGVPTLSASPGASEGLLGDGPRDYRASEAVVPEAGEQRTDGGANEEPYRELTVEDVSDSDGDGMPLPSRTERARMLELITLPSAHPTRGGGAGGDVDGEAVARTYDCRSRPDAVPAGRADGHISRSGSSSGRSDERGSVDVCTGEKASTAEDEERKANRTASPTALTSEAATLTAHRGDSLSVSGTNAPALAVDRFLDETNDVAGATGAPGNFAPSSLRGSGDTAAIAAGAAGDSRAPPPHPLPDCVGAEPEPAVAVPAGLPPAVGDGAGLLYDDTSADETDTSTRVRHLLAALPQPLPPPPPPPARQRADLAEALPVGCLSAPTTSTLVTGTGATTAETTANTTTTTSTTEPAGANAAFTSPPPPISASLPPLPPHRRPRLLSRGAPPAPDTVSAGVGCGAPDTTRGGDSNRIAERAEEARADPAEGEGAGETNDRCDGVLEGGSLAVRSDDDHVDGTELGNVGGDGEYIGHSNDSGYDSGNGAGAGSNGGDIDGGDNDAVDSWEAAAADPNVPPDAVVAYAHLTMPDGTVSVRALPLFARSSASAWGVVLMEGVRGRGCLGTLEGYM